MGNLTDYPLQFLGFGVTKAEAIKRFCNYLSQRKTPDDIFDELIIYDISVQYAPCYICELHFDFNWLAQITETTNVQGKSEYSSTSDAYIQNEINAYKRGWLQGAYGDHGDTREFSYQTTSEYFDRGSSTAFINHLFPAQSGYLIEIDDSFYPDVKTAIDNFQFGTEISRIEELNYLNENALSFDEAVSENVLTEKINSYIYEHIHSVYGSNQHKVEDVNYVITNKMCESLLCPVYIISYTYKDKGYRAFINAHNLGQKSIFNKNMGVVCGEIPIQTEKPKGLFAKIKAEKNKRDIKKQTRIEAEQKWTSVFG